MHNVEFAGLVVGVVFGVIAVDHVSTGILFEMNMPASRRDLRIVVKIDFVGRQQRLVCFYTYGASQVSDRAFYILRSRADANETLIGRSRRGRPRFRLLSECRTGQN